jgi:hypothetical protein
LTVTVPHTILGIEVPGNLLPWRLEVKKSSK